MTAPDANQRIAWPPQRFYWASTDAPVSIANTVVSGTPTGDALLQSIEHEIPQPVEELHACFVRTSDDRVLACAARRSDIASLPTGTLALIPAALPECFEGMRCEVGTINLLLGPLTPQPIREQRRGRSLLLCAAVFAALGLFALGTHRRASAWEREAKALRTDASAVLERVTGEQDTQLALAMARGEHERLRASREVSLAAAIPDDAARTLAEILALWPDHPGARPENFSISGGVATISVHLPEDPQGFLTALAAPTGWKLDEPRLIATPEGTRVTIVLRADSSWKSHERASTP